jgi:hypothetical protein
MGILGIGYATETLSNTSDISAGFKSSKLTGLCFGFKHLTTRFSEFISIIPVTGQVLSADIFS